MDEQGRLFDDAGNPTSEALPDGEGLDASPYVIEPAVDEEGPAEPLEVTTAFVVLLEQNGDLTVTADLATDVTIHRAPTNDDMYGAMAITVQDWVSPSEKDEAPRDVDTGWLCIVGRDGARFAMSDVNTPLILDRHPVSTDVAMVGACICKDIANHEVASETANMVIMGQVQLSQQVMQAQRAAAEKQEIAQAAHQLAMGGRLLDPQPGPPRRRRR